MGDATYACMCFFFFAIIIQTRIYSLANGIIKKAKIKKRGRVTKKKIGIPSGRRARKFVSYAGVTMVNFQYNYVEKLIFIRLYIKNNLVVQ